MNPTIRMADSKGRVTLPGFANATVIIEAVGKHEFRVRKAKVIAEDELVFSEEQMPIELSERDAYQLLDALKNPPKPNATARRAARRFKANHA